MFVGKMERVMKGSFKNADDRYKYRYKYNLFVLPKKKSKKE